MAWLSARRAEPQVTQDVERAAAEREEALAEATRERWTEGAVELRKPVERAPDEGLGPPDPHRFEGRGRVRGRLHVPPGTPEPEQWTVDLVPSRVLIGGQRAEARHASGGRGDLEFAFEDLPLGGYELVASAPGLQSTPWQVLLVRGQSDVFLNVGLEPRAVVEGQVRDARGAPVVGLGVVLESASDGARREQRTDGAGSYLFQDVLDGTYRLTFGSPDNPLHGPLELVVQAPRLTVPPVRLPELGSVEVTVTDERGVLIAGARVRGFGRGNTGGLIEGETDSAGRVRADLLAPGSYRIYATLPEVGRGFADVDLQPGATATVTIEIAPR